MGENFVWAQSSLNAAKRESSNRWCQLDPTAKQTNRETEKKGENNFDSLAACCGVVVVGAPTRAVHQTQQQPCSLSLSLSSIPHNNNNNHTLFFFSLLSVCLSAVRAGPPTERERKREREKGK
jgi:hypothetical protein